MRNTAAVLVLILGLALLLASFACGGSAQDTPSDERLRVAVTVSPITNIVENMGGTRISVEGIVPEGTNSHTYVPAPSVARVLSAADLIVLNGLFLEEPTLEMAQANKREDARILTLGDQTISQDEWKFDFSFPRSEGHPNPHLWPDPILALEYAETVKDQLGELDPDNAGYYEENYQKFRQRIEDLDQRIYELIETVPPQNRKLLTYHDSWAYFATRYGMEVIGAVQPSDFSEPSAREVARLIDQVREQRVPALFGSEVFPSHVLEQVAREAGAQYIDKLRDDDLPGSPGDARHSYLGLMVENLETMIPALGGNASTLQGFDTSQVFQGNSGAIYPQ